MVRENYIAILKVSVNVSKVTAICQSIYLSASLYTQSAGHGVGTFELPLGLESHD